MSPVAVGHVMPFNVNWFVFVPEGIWTRMIWLGGVKWPLPSVAHSERWCLGAPENVIWNIRLGTTVRAPYSGFIEFSMSHYHWVPPETSEEFSDRMGVGTAMFIAGQTYTQTVRYEYDIRPDGAELAKGLVRYKNYTGTSDWNDLQKADVCWDNAARRQPTPPEKPSAK